MTKLIDISVPLRCGMPAWPGSTRFSHIWVKRLDCGDDVNSSVMTVDIHAGTHIDAPLHFLDGGNSVDMLDLNLLCGPVYVVECEDPVEITAGFLDSAALPTVAERLLVKSSNSRLWEQNEFNPDFAAFTEAAAQWIVDRGIRLVGVDYLSVQHFNDPPLVHNILLHAGVVVLEGLDLSKVSQGVYELICLPLSIEGAEGAPARAVLREMPEP